MPAARLRAIRACKRGSPIPNRLQILCLDVRGRACALRASAVREILPVPRLHRPPEAPKPLAGFMDVGGAVVPVVRLDILLGLEAEAEPDVFYGHVVRLRQDAAGARVGLLVDRVTAMKGVESDDLRPMRDDQSLNGLVEAEISQDGALTSLLSADRLLLEHERTAVAEWARRAAERAAQWSPVP
jgi:purine-binding chemotaxis protein CheW